MSSNTSQDDDLGHRQGQWEQGVGGYIQFRVWATPKEDTRRWNLPDPPHRVVPIIFLPGIMGSNLRMSKERQKKLDRKDNRAWRPDDLSPFDVLSGTGYGGLMRNARAHERQLNFDPSETEVDYYHYTENADMFDPGGDETIASDARHRNIPDSFAEIPPMLTNAKPPPPEASMREKMKTRERAAQKARWRGWSEVLYGGAYGDLLRNTEGYMNNILTTVAGQTQYLQPRWHGSDISAKDNPIDPRDTARHSRLYPQRTSASLQELLRQGAAEFGANDGAPVTEAELRKIAHCWYPVHAMGYNWLKSNGDNAKEIAKRIRAVMALYTKRGLTCDKVILVTHSMGGLLARALIHPKYGNLKEQVLGIYHNVMPTHGAAAAYKRIRCGFEGGWPLANVLGKDGKDVTCVLANSPGGLELLPNQHYGKPWLKVVDQNNKLLMQWPSPQFENFEQRFIRDQARLHPDLVSDLIQRKTAEATPERDIYTQPESAWWRLFNPLWVNPANLNPESEDWMTDVMERTRKAAVFYRDIAQTFHPVTYASYCASSTQLSYGDVVWKVQPDSQIDSRYLDVGTAAITAQVTKVEPADDGPPQTWRLVSEDGAGRLVVQTRVRRLTLKLQAPDAPGDGTVPAARSAEKVVGFKFAHGTGNNQASYTHQDSYANPQVLASALYAIVKIAGTAPWWEK